MFDFDKFDDSDSATIYSSKNATTYDSKNATTYGSTISDVKNTEEEDAAAESLAKQMEELNRKNEESNRRLREQAEAEKLKREKEEEKRVRELEAAVVKQKIDKEAEERKAFYEELKSEYEKDKSESHSAEKKQSIFSAFLSSKQKEQKVKSTGSSKPNSKLLDSSKSGNKSLDKKAKKQTGDSLKRLMPFVSKNKSNDSSNHPDTEKEFENKSIADEKTENAIPTSKDEALKTEGRTSELSQSESEELKTVGRTSEPSHSKGEELKTESVTPTPKDDTVPQNGVDHRSTPRSDEKHHTITETVLQTVSQKDESPKDEELTTEDQTSEPLQSKGKELKTEGRTSELSQSESEELKTVGRTSEPLQNESEESKTARTSVPKSNSMFDVFSGLTKKNAKKSPAKETVEDKPKLGKKYPERNLVHENKEEKKLKELREKLYPGNLELENSKDNKVEVKTEEPDDDYLAWQKRIAENETRLSADKYRSMLHDVQERRDDVAAIALITSDMKNLIVIKSLDEFFQFVEGRNYDVKLAYAFVVYKHEDPRYYLEVPNDPHIQGIMKSLYDMMMHNSVIVPGLIAKIPNIGIFENVYFN